jgi:hypothetical protein
VNALVDGNVVRDLVVAGGAIDLPPEQFQDGASVVLVSLVYGERDHQPANPVTALTKE